MPLSPRLYDLLRERFRHVRTVNEGEEMSFRYVTNALTGRTSLDIQAHGESYATDCPFCHDGRQRLYLNHRYGAPDPETGSDNLHLAKCFNENCLADPAEGATLRRQLAEKVFGLLNRDQRRHMLSLGLGRPTAATAARMQPCPAPGTLLGLGQLSPGHPALEYLAERGFDPAELGRVWKVAYCTEADPKFPQAQGRLVIPVVMNGAWVGWQARYVGTLAWNRERVPKYTTMPGFAKRLALYNHDLALRQPLVVVCEGASDVWRVGPAGVALLGKQASVQQQRLLSKGWGTKPIVVLLDGDAAGDATRLMSQLGPWAKGGLVKVRLPVSRDPGSYGREELWSLIHKQADEQGVTLPRVGVAVGPSESVFAN